MLEQKMDRHEGQAGLFPQPLAGSRDWYAFEALRMLPRIILMIDKNPFSATYGCFDREYWHYRTADFPCGMSQEFCLPLALAYAHPFPGNRYRGKARLKELTEAGIDFARRSSHSDGSCDDYFPYEQALGALVFSTYAMTESYRLLGLERPELVEFFKLRGDWLCRHNESGQLSNHQALAALALYNVYSITGEVAYREASDRFRDLTLSWQHEEGWFQEYEGADPGYQSCTIDFLAKLFQKSGDPKLLEPLKRAVEFAAYFLHPDGSFAGEYGSRNTYHFYPHGFELMSRHSRTAGQVADTFLRLSMPNRSRYYNDDNRMCAHYVYNWMQSWLDYNPVRAGPIESARPPFERWFPAAGLFVKKTPRYYAVVALNKGGVFKSFDAEGPLRSDTGLIAETEDGRVLVGHLVSNYDIRREGDTFHIRGYLHRRKRQLSTPVKQIVFRMINLTIGRFCSDLVRRLLQKILITGKPATKVAFSRSLRFESEHIAVEDSIDARESNLSFSRLAVGSDATSIYVANSNTFQESTLLPWVDLSEHTHELNRARVVRLPERRE